MEFSFLNDLNPENCRQLLEFAFQKSSDAVFVVKVAPEHSPHTFITTVYVNDSAVIVSGYSKDELMQKSIDNLIFYGSRCAAVLYEIAQKHKPVVGSLTNSQGEIIPIEINCQQHTISNETLLFIFFKNCNQFAIQENRITSTVAGSKQTSLQPVTSDEDLDATDSFQEKQQYLADKMASISALVSGIAHEINNPNSLIMLSSDLLRELCEDIKPVLDSQYDADPAFAIRSFSKTALHQNIVSLLNNISSGSERISNTIGALRDFVHTDLNEKITLLDINQIINSAVRIANNLIKMSTDNLTLSLGENIPAFRGYAQQMQQAILNLITNACQALNDQSQKIEISSAYLNELNEIVLVIKDEGEGINPENIHRVMNPFFTTRREYGHAGLGLSVTYTIVKNHQGYIDIESKHGFGTTVQIRLPIKFK